jgi:DNA-binding transcriptional LysR family regulator
MERARRLQQLWNWLPAFRAVAEPEHLPTAAQQLFITPPALSRTIKQLESELGHPLFDRVGRRLRLNAAGQKLLLAVRDAMRRLDDAVQAISGQTLQGPIRLAAPMPFLSLLVLPVVESLTTEHPGIIPQLSSVSAEAGNTRLLNGELDLVLVDDPVPSPHLLIERISGIGYGVYCGPGHPLWEAETVTAQQLSEHPFAAPPEGYDHWPAHLPRQVTLVLSHLQLGVEACANGRYLAVLPELVARHNRRKSALRRLPFEAFEHTALYAVRRPPLSGPGLVDHVLEAIRERLQALHDPRT